MGLTEKNGTEMVLPMTCTSIKTGVLYYSETPDFFFFEKSEFVIPQTMAHLLAFQE